MQPTAAISDLAAQLPPLVVRPVTTEDPASFCCGRMRLADGSPNPDYGCVFWAEDSRGVVMFSFDREGWQHASTEFPSAPLPTDGWLELHGRLFRIAGPSAEHRRWSQHGCAGRMAALEPKAAA